MICSGAGVTLTRTATRKAGGALPFYRKKAKGKFPGVVVKAGCLVLLLLVLKGIWNQQGCPFVKDFSYSKNHNGENLKLVPMQLFH